MSLRDHIAAVAEVVSAVDQWDGEFTQSPRAAEVPRAWAALDARPELERAQVVALLADPTPEVRREAANACARWRRTDAREALVAALADPREDVREAAGHALVAVARETALATIAAAGARCGKGVLADAIDAALEAFGARVLPWVEQVDYAPDPTRRRRGEPWWTLYGLAPEAAAEVLARKVATRRFDWVYGAATLVREQGGGPWVRQAFSPLVGDPDHAIARLAAEVLHDFGEPADLEPLVSAAASATHAWQRAAALTAALDLAQKAHRRVLGRLWPVARDADAQEVVLRAIAAAGRASPEPQALLEQVVRTGLKHPREQVVAPAISAALALGLDALAPEVMATLRLSAREVADARAGFLRAAPQASLTALTALFAAGVEGRGSTEVAAQAAYHLAEVDVVATPERLRLARAALESTDGRLRRAGAFALGRLLSRHQSAALNGAGKAFAEVGGRVGPGGEATADVGTQAGLAAQVLAVPGRNASVEFGALVARAQVQTENEEVGPREGSEVESGTPAASRPTDPEAEAFAAEAASALVAHARRGPAEEASTALDALVALGDGRALEVALARTAAVLGGAPIPGRAEDAWLCFSAIAAFRVFATDARAWAALEAALRHGDFRLRRDASEAFGRIGEVRARPLLAPLVQDRERQVRQAATRALAALAGEEKPS